MKKYLVILLLVLLLVFGIYFFNNSNSKQNSTNNLTDNTQAITLQVIISDNSTSIYQVSFESGQKLLGILTTFSQNNPNFTFETNKSVYGDFLLTVNGIKADTTKEFWNIKYNGIDSMLGISDLEPKNNDIISLTLLNY